MGSLAKTALHHYEIIAEKLEGSMSSVAHLQLRWFRRALHADFLALLLAVALSSCAHFAARVVMWQHALQPPSVSCARERAHLRVKSVLAPQTCDLADLPQRCERASLCLLARVFGNRA